MSEVKLHHLAPYLTFGCPLTDNSYTALLARLIISFVGKYEISVMVGRFRNESTYVDCCISTNGSFYLISEDPSQTLGYHAHEHSRRHRESNINVLSYKELENYNTDMNAGTTMRTMYNTG